MVFQAATNGFGTNFTFGDPTDPTTMVHAWMANAAQQLISPARISQITALKGSNRLASMIRSWAART